MENIKEKFINRDDQNTTAISYLQQHKRERNHTSEEVEIDKLVIHQNYPGVK